MALNPRWWSERTGLSRFDLVSRWQLYLLSACEPLLGLLVLGGLPRVPVWLAVLVLGLTAVHAAACLALLRAGLARVAGGPRPSAALIGLAVATTASCVLVSWLAVRPVERPAADLPVRFLLVVLLCGALTVAATPLLPTRRLAVAIAVPGAVLGLVGGQPRWTILYLLWIGFTSSTYRFTVWYLGVVWEVEHSRRVQERLAVAEERLRFARDLHDVLGRNLTLIALDSELAVRLVQGGQDGPAIEQMTKVRQAAQDSMREIRDVVSGYRGVDLEAELAGARSLLRSAGIDTRVVGSATGLTTPAQTALGWVVREAVTNIIRHSEATAVRLDLDVATDAVRGPVAVLRIENDGVVDPGPHPGGGDRGDRDGGHGGRGAGLEGLRERLAPTGGELSAGAEPGRRFVVQARVPLATPEPVA